MDIQSILDRFGAIPVEQKIEILSLLERLEETRKIDAAHERFLDYVKFMWEDFILGSHHKIMAEAFDEIIEGKNDRLIICMPPRHTKSEFASIYLPSYFLGKYPNKKIIQASHTAELAVGFGRKVRALVASDKYQGVFSGVRLSADSKAAGRWSTNKGGEYFAIGVGGAVAGKGADLCVSPESRVQTPLGSRLAKEIKVGDYLYGMGGYGRVRHVVSSLHEKTAIINESVKVSEFHPIWIVGRGWVPAKDIQPGDCMTGLSIMEMCSIKALQTVRSLYEKTRTAWDDKVAGIHGVERDAPSLQGGIWGAWNYRLRRMGEKFSHLLGGYGAVAVGTAQCGQDRQQRKLRTFQLPMGNPAGAGEQQEGQCSRSRFWGDSESCAMGAFIWHPLFAPLPQTVQDEASAGTGSDSPESGAQSEQAGFAESKWRNRWAIRFLERGGDSNRLRNSRHWPGLLGKTKDFLRILMGVRTVRSINVVSHEPMEFVNFHVEGHNTFLFDNVMGHNCIIDDPHSEQDQVLGESNPAIYDKVMEWYEGGPRQRLQPGGAIVLVQTRWSMRDLTGQLLKKQMNEPNSDQWKVIEFPAILPSGNPVWPEYWSAERLLKTKASIPISKWNAQYQQNPVFEEGALIKREYWKDWTQSEPPKNIDIIIQSWDTAFSASTRANYSACTTWGVFKNEETNQNNLILLDAIRGKWEFPALKEEAYRHYKLWKPDICLIETRAAGAPLVYELRSMGIPVQDVMVARGTGGNRNDKITRVNSVTDIFASGNIWAQKSRTFAQEVIEECAAFPAGENDDYVDTVTMAIQRFRMGGWIGARLDDSEDDMRPIQKRTYY